MLYLRESSVCGQYDNQKGNGGFLGRGRGSGEGSRGFSGKDEQEVVADGSREHHGSR